MMTLFRPSSQWLEIDSEEALPFITLSFIYVFLLIHEILFYEIYKTLNGIQDKNIVAYF